MCQDLLETVILNWLPFSTIPNTWSHCAKQFWVNCNSSGFKRQLRQGRFRTRWGHEVSRVHASAVMPALKVSETVLKHSSSDPISSTYWASARQQAGLRHCRRWHSSWENRTSIKPTGHPVPSFTNHTLPDRKCPMCLKVTTHSSTLLLVSSDIIFLKLMDSRKTCSVTWLSHRAEKGLNNDDFLRVQQRTCSPSLLRLSWSTKTPSSFPTLFHYIFIF